MRLILLQVAYITLVFISTVIPLLVGVAFLTLLERKSMASFQNRRGPNVVGFFGILQPIADGLKLLLKETVIPYKSTYVLYCLAPLSSFLIALSLWFLVPLYNDFVLIHSNLSLLLLLGLSSLNVYSLLLSGWFSNSNYATLGAIRAASQMLSYEISMTLTIMPVVLVTRSLDFIDILNSQRGCWYFFILLPSCIFFYISILAETNRPPFDLPEAEAELVSGYNVEYSSMYFALFFLAEYANILLMSYVFVILYLGGPDFFWYQGFIVSCIKLVLVVFSFIWVRSSYPRYRFDQLMHIGWKVILPLSLSYCFFMSNMFYFFFT